MLDDAVGRILSACENCLKRWDPNREYYSVFSDSKISREKKGKRAKSETRRGVKGREGETRRGVRGEGPASSEPASHGPHTVTAMAHMQLAIDISHQLSPLSRIAHPCQLHPIYLQLLFLFHPSTLTPTHTHTHLPNPKPYTMEVANPIMSSSRYGTPAEYRQRKVALISGEWGEVVTGCRATSGVGSGDRVYLQRAMGTSQRVCRARRVRSSGSGRIDTVGKQVHVDHPPCWASNTLR